MLKLASSEREKSASVMGEKSVNAYWLAFLSFVRSIAVVIITQVNRRIVFQVEGHTVIVKEFFNQINMGEDHSPTAVSF
jgi:hypothetical protein